MWNESFPATRHGRASAAAVLIVACMLVIPVALVDPAQSRRFPRCAFHELTGLHCPGCGATRAVHQALHGRFSRALSANLLLVLASPWIFYEFVSGWYFVGRGRGLRTIPLRAEAAWGILVFVCVFSILRNIPATPFQWLAP